jgi:hypothetical protein
VGFVSEEGDVIEHGRPAPAWTSLFRRRPPALIVTAAAGIVAAALIAVIVIVATGPANLSPGPYYASPTNPCALLSMATVTKYVPGASAGVQLPNQDRPVQGSGPWAPGPLSSRLPTQAGGDCLWSANSAVPRQLAESLDVDVSLYSSATGSTGAQQNFEADLQFEKQGIPGSSAVTGTRPLTGLGHQATAIYAIITGNGPATPSVVLLTWSGNAEIVVSYTVPGASSHSPISRPALLAAATAATRDVLTALPRTP